MGLGSAFRRSNGPRTGARREVQSERFGRYFPRLFAYSLVATGEEQAARELTVSAFTETFALPDMREAEFEVEVFRIARDLTQRSEARNKPADGLSTRERDVISLIFDAQLNREQIGLVLGVKPETVVTTLFRGLRKLKAHVSNPAPNAQPMPTFS
jgi:hypothetical protein